MTEGAWVRTPGRVPDGSVAMSQRIEVRDVHVSYGGVKALRGVSLTVPKGDVVSVVGANGVGKSTLLRALSGLVRIEMGMVTKDGEDITNVAAHRIAREGVAHVPEGRRIVASLSVEDNLKVTFRGSRTRAAMNSMLEEMYAIFPRLGERRKQPGGLLSGGEQQMLALARAIMSNPSYLLLDEPSMGLAPIMIDQIYDLLQPDGPILANRGVLIAEQSAILASSLSSYTAVLAKGVIVMEGTTAEMSVNEMIEAYLGQGADEESG